MKHVERLLFEQTFPMFLEPDFAEGLRNKDNQQTAADTAERIFRCSHGQRFDCKGLDRGFVRDTGSERYEELLQSGEGIRLPFSASVFEFSDLAVFVEETAEWLGGRLDEDTTNFEKTGWKRYNTAEASVVTFDGQSSMTTFVVFETMELHTKQDWHDDCKYDPVIIFNEEDNDRSREGAILLLGVLTLMEERLLRERTVSRAESTIAKRKRKGKLEFVSYRVLSLNLAETRRRTSSVRLMKHESPRLHWRRGHWRAIGRLSEFERKTWIKRCLVGDPEKGFAEKHYSVVWQPTIH